ncbi:MAG: glycosyltransferase [Candidatus Solibacter sp.]|jgi:2-phospho-L-lactate transferase/gluconeogenesis factor (CofD/UPF0052 family)
MKRQLDIVLFSGGRGTQSISEVLLKHPQVSLSVIINAYDDGLSTGAIRRFVPGMLGPSDVRKNLNRMMRCTDDCDHALRAVSDHRLEVGVSFDDGVRLLEAFQACRRPADEFISEHYRQLSIEQAEALAGYCGAFLVHVLSEADQDNRFSFSDCAIGNIFFAGAFLQSGRDFNRTIGNLANLYKIRGRLLNITRGENYFLVARNVDGTFLRSEAEIVSDERGGVIDRLYLLEEDLYRQTVECTHDASASQLQETVDRAARLPHINPEAAAALQSADIIIYGPGTQHSSLFPSYLTVGVAEAITANQEADKLFLANIWHDLDIQREDATSLVKKFVQTMSRYNQVECGWANLVTHFFFQEAPHASAEAGRYVTFDQASFEYPLERVKLVDWETGSGKHSGGRVFEELYAIVQSRIDLTRKHYAVSIIVPVRNEARTIAEVLTGLQALDFARFDLGKEIIVVDSGSSDGTADIAAGFRGIKVIRLPAGSGKGEAVRAGIKVALGNALVTFPGDGEYYPEDLYAIVEAIVKNGCPVVFGSRASKCLNLNDRIRGIYGTVGIAFLVSKYGGMLLSIITLLLYNKYVSDLLTSVKGFDASAIRGLHLHAKSFDLEAELTAKLAMKQNYILELPVEYRPRTKSEGKKIRVSDGLRCIVELFRHKLFWDSAK